MELFHQGRWKRMQEGQLRQRRNLLITCVLLWVMKFGGVSFTKMSFAGFDVEFKNPGVLLLAIWIAFAYFLFRYFQYYTNEGTAALNREFNAAMERKCEKYIRAFVDHKYPDNNPAHLYSYGLLTLSKGIYNGQTLAGRYDEATGTVEGNESFALRINWQVTWRGRLAAILDTIFRNSVVTDYLLPFAIAGYVLLYCGADNWNGSFLRLK